MSPTHVRRLRALPADRLCPLKFESFIMNRHFFLPGAFLLVASLASAEPQISLRLRIGIPSPVIVREAPPPRVVERVHVSPSPDHVWVPGHHVWDDGQWVWARGSWERPPQPDAYWVDNRWDPETRQFTEAHWEVREPPPPPPPPPRHADFDDRRDDRDRSDREHGDREDRGRDRGNDDRQDRGRRDRHDHRSIEVVVSDAPPPPPREARTRSPGRGHVWISGYWGWDGNRREWVRGHWERPPHRRAVWNAPRWDRRGRDWVYIRGSWR